MADLSRQGLVRIAAEAMGEHRAQDGPDDGWACNGCAWVGYDVEAFYVHQHGAQVDALLAALADDCASHGLIQLTWYAGRLRGLVSGP
jgi:hypothetical protein